MTLPGLRGLEHVAFTVPDLEEAVRFFTEVLGCEHFYDIGPFRDPDGTWFADNQGLHPRAEVPRAALLRCGHGSNFEIFEFRAPDQRREMPKMSDWGGVHLCFYVDDIDAAIAYLEEQEGIRILGGAKETMGIEAGKESTFAHFLSPWGLMLELVSYPHGRKYMEGRDRLMWSPVSPAT
jgi:catechol 2,3-dioxygenase-like lactoylglutathione lyase family enzyme